MNTLMIFVLCHISFGNISLKQGCHHCRWQTAKFRRTLDACGLFSREGCLSCHTCCDTGPRFYGLIRGAACYDKPGWLKTCSKSDLHVVKIFDFGMLYLFWCYINVSISFVFCLFIYSNKIIITSIQVKRTIVSKDYD